MKPATTSAQSVEKRLKNFREVDSGLSKRQAIEEARNFPQSHDPSCRPKCPLGVNIPEFVRLLREGQISDAYKKIREANMLPGICGRLCLAPCEEEFVIGGRKMPVDIRALERFVADHGRPRLFGRDKLTCAGQRVAVIGSGPSGLSAAATLARDLYCVTVFESQPLPGGVLRYGIPGFRLPVSVLDAEISQLRDLGVQFRMNETLGCNVCVSDLQRQGFAAVLLATGRPAPALADIPGDDAQGVFYAQELLLKLSWSEDIFVQEFSKKLGDSVLIVGGQDMALDCARACRRIGKHVGLVFAGTEEDVNAHRVELEHCKEEGVILHMMLKPLKVEMNDKGGATGLRCRKMDFAERSGQWVLMPVPGAEQVLSADAVVIAGRRSISPALRKIFPDLKILKDQTVHVDEQTGLTSLPGVFAAGDLIDAREHVLDAMTSGVWAAQQIIQYCQSDKSLL